MGQHLSRHHPEISLSQSRSATTLTPAKTQRSIKDAFQQPYSVNSDKHKKITRAVGLCIAENMQPYSVVEDAGFNNLLTTLDPRYVVPSRTYFSDTVIPDIYDTARKDIEDDLAKAHSFALTTDSWTSRATESYLTVTVHYMLNWDMKSAVLQTRPMYEGHTSANLADELCTAVDEWKLKRPNITIPVTTDNAPNIVNAVNEAEGLGPQIGCFAHTVNLAAKRALSNNPAVSRLLGKVRRVVSFSHKSTTANCVLKEKQKSLNLKEPMLVRDVSTRWNSTHDMLKLRYVEHQPAIYSALMDQRVKKNVTKDMAVLNDDEQRLAEQLIQVLQPLKKVTKIRSSKTIPTTSMILPLKDIILKAMVPGGEDTTAIRDAKAAITKDLEKRYTVPDLQKYLLKATALDPRFKSLPFIDEPSRSQLFSDLTTEILEHEQQSQVAEAENEARPSTEEWSPSPSPPQKKSAMAEIFGEVFKTQQAQARPLHLLVEEEVTQYMLGDCLDVDGNPFKWWEKEEGKFPRLAKVAQRHFCVPGTSVPSERVFSTAGDIVSACRSRLDPDNVDRLVFLQKNLKLEKKK
ncbi:E3 SUMO-protein ligase ZBED1-like [Aulostomus maculatus]